MSTYTLRDIDNRDDDWTPFEATGTLAELAGYIDGPLLADLTDPGTEPGEWGAVVRAIAAEMRADSLTSESRARLAELGVTIAEAGAES